MRRLLYALLLGSGLAGAVPATDLKLNQPVIDTVQMLSASQREALGQKLRGWQREGLMQGAVVIVDDFDGASSFDYAMAIFQRWQLGDKDRDNGLLLVIGRDNRQFRLITGRGLEGALPDVAVRKLLQGQLVPNFRQQRYAEGIEAVLTGAVERLRASPEGEASPSDGPSPVPLLAALAIATILAPIIGGGPSAGVGTGVSLLAGAASGADSSMVIGQMLMFLVLWVPGMLFFRGLYRLGRRLEASHEAGDGDRLRRRYLARREEERRRDSGWVPPVSSSSSSSRGSSYDSSSSSSSSDYGGGGGDSAGGGDGGSW